MEFLKLDRMTRFERARIISARALQIEMGAPVLIDGGGGSSPIELAKKEFEAGVVPLTVRSIKPPKIGEQ